MKTRTKHFVSIVTLIVFFVLGVASHPAKNSTYSDAANWIPADFNPNDGILLIEIHPRNTSQNEKMTEFLAQNYPYKYEVVDRGMIQGKPDKYADTKVYRFGVLWDFKMSQHNNIDANGKMSFQTDYDLYGQFIDRSTNKVYPRTTKANHYGQTGYEPFFNSVIQHFK